MSRRKFLTTSAFLLLPFSLRDLIEIADKTKGSAAQVQDYQTTCENVSLKF